MISEQEEPQGPVAELAAMIDAATQEGERLIWDHTPEEIGLHIMENASEIRAALIPDALNAEKAVAASVPYEDSAHPAYAELQVELDRQKKWRTTPALDKAVMPDPAVGERCRCCGSADLEWQTAQTIQSSVVQGRLNTNDVQCVFYLGCMSCSETLRTMTADQVAAMMPFTTPVEEPEKGAVDRITQRVSVFAIMGPEEDEDWESWYHAAFDMLSAEIAALAATNAGQVEAGPALVELMRVLDKAQGDKADDAPGTLAMTYGEARALRMELAELTGERVIGKAGE